MFVIILSVIVLLGLLYKYITRNHDYWKKKNVPHDPPVPFFGNNFDIQFGRKSLGQKGMEIYNKSKNEKVFGYYRGTIPELYINDPDIIRHILSVDFSYFHYRGFGLNTDLEPLGLNLFNVEGDTWKLVRQRLTPAFTTAKLKGMFPLIVRCAEKLKTVLDAQIQKGGDVCDVREIMARYATEFIGACGFGIDMDTINNEKTLYRDLGKVIIKLSFSEIFKLGLVDAVPELKKIIYTGNKKTENIIFEIVTKVCEQRNYKPSGRHDFIDLLLELRAKGTLVGESLEKMNEDGKPIIVEKKFDHTMLVAQAFVFFAGGFETSSSTSSYALHHLAFNPDIQTRAQEEIKQVLSKYDNKLCYDAVAEMSLLNMIVKEALRMCPPLGILNRVCARKYTIPGLNLTIDPGVKIAISSQSIHMDEKYYDNPGSRLGEMQAVASLAAFLCNFSVEPAECTKYKPEIEPKALATVFKNGLPLKIKRKLS
ncbi:cytochrome P450 6B2-like [Hyposmocoma kahamanoa]|uniref:cytochrome P450 6B2-like n=1 Tax=Hyposmocoma kahamanoa TaxID=1477025 RepID=UPI000E6D9F0D|nr:cytochrome P450 6B2-like [Hyposmocoma kahamanoa]